MPRILQSCGLGILIWALTACSQSTLGEGPIDLRVRSQPATVSNEQLNHWIENGARAVSSYYGRFPVKRVTIDVSATADGHEIHGRTYAGRRIEMQLGPQVTPADLDDDWTMTHEMFHLAFPDMGNAHEWMNEGLSTYLEPVARTRIGVMPVERFWRETVEGLPKGQPERGDKGLDRTHTWGRTYWGGCMFWFLADIRIREQTHGAKSLQDALRAILDAGGDGSVEWTTDRVIQLGDAATGTHVLKDLYGEMSTRPVTVDLNALWSRLGVKVEAGHVTFDDAAPLADVRRAITR